MAYINGSEHGSSGYGMDNEYNEDEMKEKHTTITTVEGIVEFLSKESDRLWDEYKKYHDAAHDDIMNFRKSSNQQKANMAYGGHAEVYRIYKKIRDANAVKDKGLAE